MGRKYKRRQKYKAHYWFYHRFHWKAYITINEIGMILNTAILAPPKLKLIFNKPF